MNPVLPTQRRQYALQLAADHLRYTRKHFAPTCRLGQDVQTAELQVKMRHTLLE